MPCQPTCVLDPAGLQWDLQHKGQGSSGLVHNPMWDSLLWGIPTPGSLRSGGEMGQSSAKQIE